jgi:outer membrane immunogenic protein
MTRIWKPVLAAAVVAGSLGSAELAHADGMPSGPRAVAERPWTWSGFYVGLHAGKSWASSDWVQRTEDASSPITDVPVGTVIPQSPEGLIGGLHAGIQRQWGNFVFGGELSYSSGQGRLVNDNGVLIVPCSSCGGVGTYSNTYKTSIDNLFTATARLGVAIDRVMVYGKAGYAAAKIETEVLDDPNTGGIFGDFWSSGGVWHQGYTAGVGVEYMVVPSLVLGIEYNFTNLQSRTHDGDVVFFNVFPATTQSYTVDPDAIHSIMGRVSLKFNHDESRRPFK